MKEYDELKKEYVNLKKDGEKITILSKKYLVYDI